MKSSYTHITETATTDAGMCNRDAITFHMQNPNGIWAEWRAVCDRITQAVDDGIVPSGWIIAYGSLNHFASDKMLNLHGKHRVGRIARIVAVDMLRDDIKRANEALATIGR